MQTTKKCIVLSAAIEYLKVGTKSVINSLYSLQLLHNEEDSISKASEEASRQIVNCLVENVLSLEERAVGKRKLFFFCCIQPSIELEKIIKVVWSTKWRKPSQ